MKQQRLIIVGAVALFSVASMNFSYSLAGYSFLKGSLCSNVLAQSTTSGSNSSTGGSSNSSTGNSSSTGSTSGSSTGDQSSSSRFDVKEISTEHEFNKKVYKESVIIECSKGNYTDKCVNSCKSRTIDDNQQWSDWEPC